jgi:hypothetical protein
VLSYWDDIQAQLDLDIVVLDDLEVEARGVARHNAWLTYAEPLHQLREFGTDVAALDAVSERQLSRREIHSVVEALLVARDPAAFHTTHPTAAHGTSHTPTRARAAPLPDPDDWSAFCQAVGRLQQAVATVYCPLRQTQRPWVDLTALARHEMDPLRLMLDQVREGASQGRLGTVSDSKG